MTSDLHNAPQMPYKTLGWVGGVGEEGDIEINYY